MRLTLVAFVGVIICATVTIAGSAKITAIVTDDPASGKSKTSFESDVPQLYFLFQIRGLKSGDQIRCVWIAIDVGDAADPNTQVDDRTLTANGDSDDGEFSVSKPTDGWPVGKYKVDLYVNDELATSIKFTVIAAKSMKSEGG